RNQALPLRPEPFVFRLEWKPGAEWAGSALEEIVPEAHIIQLEAAQPLDEEAVGLLQNLDNRQEKFNLRLLISAEDSGVETIKKFIGPLSRLKKLVAVIFIIRSRSDEPGWPEINGSISAAASAGLKPGVMIELEPETSISELEQLIKSVRLSGAMEIALRQTSAANPHPVFGKNFSNCLSHLKAEGIPVSLEECFPWLKPGPPVSEPNCRRAFGSCYIDSQGRVKACRQSSEILRDLRKQKLEEIWSGYLFAEGLCSRAALTAQSLKLEANGTSEENGMAEVENLSPASLDASLRPVPLFTLKKKEWGAALIKGLDGLVLSPKGEKLARMIDGKNTLRSIRKKFGPRSAGLIYALFLRGLVRLEK
ncbi:MAG: SPASM domain-containing protein, partial [Candidatus Saccharicenans sp.]|nr:SPASM domain-containing protein [Candidatus Saccharicenans sp.]